MLFLKILEKDPYLLLPTFRSGIRTATSLQLSLVDFFGSFT